MLRLDTTTRTLQAVLSAAVALNQPAVNVSYSDKSATAYNGGQQVSNLNSTTAVTICNAPAASTIRDIDFINIRNRDTAPVVLTLRYSDNGTFYELLKVTLNVDDSLSYTHADGWQVLSASGSIKTTPYALLSGVSASIGGAALTAGQVATAAVTVQGAVVGQTVSVTPNTYPGDGVVWDGYVSAANTVTVRITAVVAVTPTASTYNIRVLP